MLPILRSGRWCCKRGEICEIGEIREIRVLGWVGGACSSATRVGVLPQCPRITLAIHRVVAPGGSKMVRLHRSATVVRTVKTKKNRGKQFWGCSKYKNGGGESGCNFFKWCNIIGGDERGSFFNSEGNKETLVNSEDMDSTRKMIGNLQKSVFIVQKWMKVLMLLVSIICVIQIVLVSMLIRKG